MDGGYVFSRHSQTTIHIITHSNYHSIFVIKIQLINQIIYKSQTLVSIGILIIHFHQEVDGVMDVE